MLQRHSPPGRASDWLTLAGLFALFGAAASWVGWRANVPVIDDWVYAWSVEQLLQTRHLRVLDISAIYPLVQILWGALFAWAGGFSFGVLRGSTIVLSVFGCWAVYLTLRELGCRWSTSALGACAVAFDPTYFALSFSYMTDVPFVSFAAIATYYYVTAVVRDATPRLWIAGGWTIAAFLVRPLAVVLPLAAVPALVLGRPDWRTAIKRSASPLIVTMVVMVVIGSGMRRAFGTLEGATMREGWLTYWFLVPMTDYLRWTTGVLIQSAFPLAPLLIASLNRWRRALLVAVLGLVLIPLFHLTLGVLPRAMADWQTWSLQDIAARAMIDGTLTPSPWSVRIAPTVQVIGLLAAGALLAICAPRWNIGGLRRWTRGSVVIATLALLHIVMINVLWFYNDRYYLVLVPPFAILAARALDADRLGKTLALACLGVWAAVALTGTRDMLAFGDACAGAVRQLEASGVPPWEIDSGWPLNGWRLYAHPENLPPGSDRLSDVPAVTSKQPTQYSIVNHPLPGYDVVRVVPLESASWQTTRAVYVLRRQTSSSAQP